MTSERTDPHPRTPNHKGAIAEEAIATEATKLGIIVSRPNLDARYDLIFDIEDSLFRVQCKWAVKSGDVVEVRLRGCRRTADGMLRRAYTADEIDAVAAYCAELDTCYLLPAHLVVDKRSICLRLQPAKNNQEIGIKWAKQYELGAIAQLGER